MRKNIIRKITIILFIGIMGISAFSLINNAEAGSSYNEIVYANDADPGNWGTYYSGSVSDTYYYDSSYYDIKSEGNYLGTYLAESSFTFSGEIAADATGIVFNFIADGITVHNFDEPDYDAFAYFYDENNALLETVEMPDEPDPYPPGTSTWFYDYTWNLADIISSYQGKIGKVIFRLTHPGLGTWGQFYLKMNRIYLYRTKINGDPDVSPNTISSTGGFYCDNNIVSSATATDSDSYLNSPSISNRVWQKSSYSWNTASGYGSFGNIAGASGATHTVLTTTEGSYKPGDQIRCQVSATDGCDTVTKSSNTATIQNHAITGIPVVGSTISDISVEEAGSIEFSINDVDWNPNENTEYAMGYYEIRKQFDSGTWSTWDRTYTPDPSSTKYINYDTFHSIPGTYTFEIRAYDGWYKSSGLNYASTYTKPTFSVTVDNTALVINEDTENPSSIVVNTETDLQYEIVDPDISASATWDIDYMGPDDSIWSDLDSGGYAEFNSWQTVPKTNNFYKILGTHQFRIRANDGYSAHSTSDEEIISIDVTNTQLQIITQGIPTENIAAKSIGFFEWRIDDLDWCSGAYWDVEHQGPFDEDYSAFLHGDFVEFNTNWHQIYYVDFNGVLGEHKFRIYANDGYGNGRHSDYTEEVTITVINTDIESISIDAPLGIYAGSSGNIEWNINDDNWNGSSFYDVQHWGPDNTNWVDYEMGGEFNTDNHLIPYSFISGEPGVHQFRFYAEDGYGDTIVDIEDIEVWNDAPEIQTVTRFGDEVVYDETYSMDYMKFGETITWECLDYEISASAIFEIYYDRGDGNGNILFDSGSWESDVEYIFILDSINSFTGVNMISLYIYDGYSDTYDTNDGYGSPSELFIFYVSVGHFSEIYIDELNPLCDWDDCSYISGLGTELEPYVIENLEFDMANYGTGITIKNSVSYLVIRNTRIINSGSSTDECGINIVNCENILFENCTLEVNQFGMLIENSDNVNITNSFIIGSTDTGIVFRNVAQSEIYGNLIEDNIQHGIIIDTVSSNLLFYNNSFISNGIHVRDTGLNINWNTMEIGNYWDNYDELDTDHDKIGELPYSFLNAPFPASYDYFPIASNDVPEIVLNPLNLKYDVETTGHNLTWQILDVLNGDMNYSVLINNMPVYENLSWNSECDITVTVDNLNVGVYNVTIIARDGLGQSISGEVWVTVQDVSVDPEPTGGEEEETDGGNDNDGNQNQNNNNENQNNNNLSLPFGLGMTEIIMGIGIIVAVPSSVFGIKKMKNSRKKNSTKIDTYQFDPDDEIEEIQ